jgi:hypothetical protein
VKLLSADDSVGFPHVKVGHCQAFNQEPPAPYRAGGFFMGSCLYIAATGGRACKAGPGFCKLPI